MAEKRSFQKGNPVTFFGQARRPAKMFRAGLLATLQELERLRLGFHGAARTHSPSETDGPKWRYGGVIIHTPLWTI